MINHTIDFIIGSCTENDNITLDKTIKQKLREREREFGL